MTKIQATQAKQRAYASLTTAESDLRQATEQLSRITSQYRQDYEKSNQYREQGELKLYGELVAKLHKDYETLDRFTQIVNRRRELVEKLQSIYDDAVEAERNVHQTSDIEAQARKIAHEQAVRYGKGNPLRIKTLEDKLYAKTLDRLRAKSLQN